MAAERPRRPTANASLRFGSADEMRAAIKAAVGDAEAWRELRPAVTRYLLRSSSLNAEQAGRIADVYWRRPSFMPMRRPRGSLGE